MASLAILYEHPLWFLPLFEALNRRGVDYVPVSLTDHCFDFTSPPPARLIFNRVAQSGFLREPEHPIFYTAALLDQWQRMGATVLNGPDVLAIDSSKARQLSLIAALGHAIPKTRVVHRAADLVAAAGGMDFPLLVKANIGGSGAGIVRYSTADELVRSINGGSVPTSIDKVLLLQDYVPPQGGVITRIETMGGRFLYAIEVESSGDNFDLCPADACISAPGRKAIAMTSVIPAPDVIVAAEQIAQAVGLDIGGVELVIDDRDSVPRFYDINALSNFVARPLEVLGWDPHERLVDWIVSRIEESA
jgi:hypothetical protein